MYRIMDPAIPILRTLQWANRPMESLELAFRLRSTTLVVEEVLEELISDNKVKKEGNMYSIEPSARVSRLALLYGN